MNIGSEVSENPPSYPKDGTYADLLCWHMDIWGTRPGGNTSVQGLPWRKKDFLKKVFNDDWELEKSRVLLGQWRGNGGTPGPGYEARVEIALFDKPPAYQNWRADLRAAKLRSKGRKNKRTPASIPRPLNSAFPIPSITAEKSREELLIDMLFGKYDHEKRHALFELCKLNILSPEEIAALKRFAKESDVKWRKIAAEALYGALSSKPKTSDWARFFLVDIDGDIRVTALRKLSTSASKVEPEIYAALKDPASTVRIQAATILLSRSQVRHSDSVAIAGLLNDQSRDVRVFAATSLLDHLSEAFVAEPNLLNDLLSVVREHRRLWPKLNAVLEGKPWLPAQIVVPYLLDMQEDLFSENAEASGVLFVKAQREALTMQRELCLAISRFGAFGIDLVIGRLQAKRMESILGAIYALGAIGISDSRVVAPLSELAKFPASSLIGEAAVACLRKLTGKRTLEIMGSNPFEEPPSSNVYPRISRKVLITNSLGLDAREAAKIAQRADSFVSDVMIRREEGKYIEEVSASSVMGMMMLAASNGSTIIIAASGPDAYDALDDIESLILSKFGEE